MFSKPFVMPPFSRKKKLFRRNEKKIQLAAAMPQFLFEERKNRVRYFIETLSEKNNAPGVLHTLFSSLH